MKIKILTHCKGFVDAEIPNDFTFLRVTLMSGDEIIEVYGEDPRWGDGRLYKTLDPAFNDRTGNFLDATYIVYPDQIEKWNERGDCYCVWQHKEFSSTYKG